MRPMRLRRSSTEPNEPDRKYRGLCRRPLITMSVLSLLLAVGISTAATATEVWHNTQLTDNATHDSSPQVSGDRVVWSGNDGSDEEIFTWTPTGGTQQLTDNSFADDAVGVSGDRVVWSGSDASDEEIFTWTPTGGTQQLTDNSFADDAVGVSGDRVVWIGYDGSDQEIFTWTPTGGAQQLTDNAYVDNFPQVSGDRVVWSGSDGSDEEIFTWTQTGGTQQLTDNSFADDAVGVSGDRVVWSGSDGSDEEIFTWTPTGGTQQLTDNSFADDAVGVSGDRVVWSGSDGSDEEIFTWTPTGGTQQLTDNSFADDAVGVSGDRVVWIGYDGNEEVFTWKVSDTAPTQLSDNSYQDFDPQVSGDRVVWFGYDDGTDEEVFTAVPVEIAAPTITGLDPSQGPAAGGNTITITGTDLAGATSVSFGGTDATGFTVDSDTQITATVPAHAAGLVTVAVTTPGGTSSQTDNYTYVAPTLPAITGLDPSQGPTTGGTSVTITGTDFTGATSVTFGGEEATSFQVDYDTQITATSPAHAAGVADVRVTTPLGGSDTSGATDDFTYHYQRLEETPSTSLHYLGPWSSLINASSSGGGYRLLASPGYAELVFEGAYLALISTTRPDYGIAEVSLDGGPAVPVDLYSRATLYQQKVWDSGVLTPGTHTLRISWTGDRNPSATNNRIALDAFDLDGSLTAGRIEEASTESLHFTGGWGTLPKTSYSAGAVRYLNGPGHAELVFTGTYVGWIAPTNYTYGIAEVSLDGGAPVQVDLYSASTRYQQLVWSSGTLAYGTHTLRVSWTGDRHASSANTYVVVDAFDIQGSLNAQRLSQGPDPGVGYRGAWLNTMNVSTSGGSYQLLSSAGEAEIAFAGTYLALITTTRPDYGTAEVSVDGGTPQEADLYSAATRYQQLVWSTGPLTDGLHTVRITWTGDKNPAATGAKIAIDAFDIVGGSSATRIQEGPGPGLTYSGSWYQAINTSASGGTYRHLNASGQADITFEGTYLALLGLTRPDYGKAAVSIDGGEPQEIDLYSSSVRYQQLLYSTGTLSDGTHTLRLSWTGTKNPASSGTRISLDALDVVGKPAIDIAQASIEPIGDLEYNGSAMTPEPFVTYGGAPLVVGVDYSVSYADNSGVGVATVTVTGMGTYSGTKSATFNILPAPAVRIEVSPGLILGRYATHRFTAVGYTSYGEPVEVQPVWSVEGEPVVGNIDQEGLFTATRGGIGQVRATVGGLIGESNVSVVTYVTGVGTDTTWDAEGSPYVIGYSLSVPAGVTLTLDAGTVVKSELQGSLLVSGSLLTNGTAAEPVVFTSTLDDSVGGDTNNDGSASSPIRGYWAGICLQAGSAASLTHTEVLWGGGRNGGWPNILLPALQIADSSPTLDHVTIAQSASNGIEITGDSSPVIEGSTIRDCSNTGIYVDASSTATPLIADSTISHNAGSGYGSGLLLVNGTSTVTRCLVKDNASIGLSKSGSGVCTITDNSFVGNTSYAMMFGGVQPILANNTGSGNGTNGMRISNLDSSWELSPQPLPYVIGYSLSVPAGVTLTLDAGTVVKSELQGSLLVSGSLLTNGTAAEPVVFTSTLDDSVGGDTNNDGSASSPIRGYWAGICLQAGSAASLTHTEVLWGGGRNGGWPNILLPALQIADSSPTLDHVTIAQSASNGIEITGDSSPVIEGSTIRDCSNTGIYVDASSTATPLIADSTISHNAGSGYGSGLLLVNGTSTVTRCLVKDNASIGLSKSGSGVCTITDNSFVGNTSYAMMFGGVQPILANNTGSGNGTNGMRISNLDSSWELSPQPLPYVIGYSLSVPAGVTLTLDAGTVVKSELQGSLLVSGSLLTNGTAAEPVVFTSTLDDSVGGDTNNDGSASSPIRGYWAGICLQAGSAASLTHTEVLWGGGRNGGWPNILLPALQIADSSPTLDHVTIAQSASNGIEITGDSSPVIEGSTIRDCSNTGIYVDASSTATPLIADSTISHNAGSGYGSGLLLVNGTSTVTRCLVKDNASIGLSKSGSGVCTITDNSFVGNTSYAMMFGGVQPILANNTGSGNGTNGMRISNLDSSWELSPQPLPYVIGYSLSVPAGVTLTLDAGTVVKSELQGSLLVSGSLLTNGTAAEPVVFTSTLDDSVGGDTNNDGSASSPIRGYWAGICLQAGSAASLTHTEVLWGGGRNGGWPNILLPALQIADSSPTLDHVTIAQSASNGIEITGDSSPVIEGSTIRDCSNTGIYVDASSTATPLIADSTISHNAGSGYGSGLLLVNGTSTVTRCLVKDNASIGLSKSGSGVCTITDNSFVGNTSYAMMFGGVQPILANNTGSGNGTNGMRISNLDSSWELSPQPLPYVIGYSLSVPAGVTLTLDAGTVVKSELQGSLLVSGSLLTNGTAAEPVVFTSTLDDSVGGDTNNDGLASSPIRGYWAGICLQAGSAASLTHTEVLWGGGRNGGWPNILLPALQIADSSPTLDHVTIAQSASNGIEITGDSSPVIRNSIVRDCLATGISVAGSSTLVINDSTIMGNGNGQYYNHGLYLADGASTVTGNSFIDNSGYDVVFGGAGQFYAPNNWWGQSSGPLPGQINTQTYTDSQGVQRTRPAVNATPWRGYAPYMATVGGAGDAFAGVPSSQNQTSSAVAEPVNVATGNFYLQETDHSIAGYGPALVFTRTYNALNPEEGALGWGWRHSLEATLKEDTELRQVSVTYPDGHGALYSIETDGSYTPAAGNFAQLAKDISGYVLTEKDQTVYTFDLDGRLLSIADRLGNTHTLSYNGGGRLTSVTDAAGSTLDLAYDSEGRLTSVTDPLGRETTYAHDGEGHLTEAIDRSGAATTYAYDDNHRMLTATDPLDRVFVKNEYDAQGRVVKQWDAADSVSTFAYLDKSVSTGLRETVFTDAGGHVTRYAYDDSYREVSQTDALGQIARFTYDADNNRTAITDKRGNTTAFTYDARGNELTRTDALGGVTTSTYSGANDLLTATDARGYTTTHSYDAAGNLTQVADATGAASTSTYDSHGLPLTLTDALDHTTSYTYDARGNLLRATKPDTTHSDATYDLAGRSLSATDELGNTTVFTYDPEDRVLTVTDPLGGVVGSVYDVAGQLTTKTDRTGRTTNYSYDPNGRLLTQTDPGGGVTAYERDADGNVTKVTDATGRLTLSRCDALDRVLETEDGLGSVTSTIYDPNGNVIRVTDAAGGVTNMVYDTLNRLTRVTDALGGVQSYAYDANGNRTSVTDPKGATVTTVYDELNRAASVTDRSGLAATSTYDAVGRLTKSVDRKGQETTYAYDDRNRLLSQTDADGTTSYVYDSAGRRTEATDAAGTIVTSYDDLGRVTERTDPNGSTVSYTYDAEGRRISVVYPDAKATTSDYDSAGRLATLTDWSSAETVYAYDSAGRLTETTYPSGLTETRSYDAAGRLGEIKTTTGSTVVEDFGYAYDSRGNRTSETSNAGTTSYTYDALSRLGSVTYPDASAESYTYDACGNRLSKSDGAASTSYAYDTAGRLTSLTDEEGATTFSYDANGNTLTEAAPAGTITFTYDAKNRTVEIGDGTHEQTMVYDADWVRTQKSLDGVTTTYVQDALASNEQVLQETSGASTTSYVLGLNRLASEDSAGRTYLHADALGSVRLATDETGTESGTTTYGAWGGVRTSSGSQSNFGFSGEEADPFGLTYLRARYYDPSMGRFLQEDPVPGLISDTQGMAAYVYCWDNPVTLTDPSGRMPRWVQDQLTARGLTKLAMKGTGVVLKNSADFWAAQAESAYTLSLYYPGSMGEKATSLYVRNSARSVSLRSAADVLGWVGVGLTAQGEWEKTEGQPGAYQMYRTAAVGGVSGLGTVVGGPVGFVVGLFATDAVNGLESMAQMASGTPATETTAAKSETLGSSIGDGIADFIYGGGNGFLYRTGVNIGIWPDNKSGR